jgi:hypothetical protein
LEHLDEDDGAYSVWKMHQYSRAEIGQRLTRKK